MRAPLGIHTDLSLNISDRVMYYRAKTLRTASNNMDFAFYTIKHSDTKIKLLGQNRSF